MNTFLPYADFSASARSLDRQRLGKQRVEVLQLLRALIGHTTSWRNHPAARMWAGHEGALAVYGLAICREWTRRGYRDTCADKIADLLDDNPLDMTDPDWLGNPAFHVAHRSNLIRKDPDHYAPQFPGVPDDLPYVWPTNAATQVKEGATS